MGGQQHAVCFSVLMTCTAPWVGPLGGVRHGAVFGLWTGTCLDGLHMLLCSALCTSCQALCQHFEMAIVPVPAPVWQRDDDAWHPGVPGKYDWWNDYCRPLDDGRCSGCFYAASREHGSVRIVASGSL
jgi:hypothetical protein